MVSKHADLIKESVDATKSLKWRKRNAERVVKTKDEKAQYELSKILKGRFVEEAEEEDWDLIEFLKS